MSIPNIKATVILCGGDSRRMGSDKALVELDGKPLLRRHVDAIRSLGLDVPIYISSGGRRYEILDDCDVTYVQDVVAGAGPLSGIAGALIDAERLTCVADHIFAMPIDTLVPPRVLLEALASAKLTPQGVALIRGERLHPVHGLFPISAAEPLRIFVESGGRAVMTFLESLKIEEVSLEGGWESCLNFNCHDDYIAACKALSRLSTSHAHTGTAQSG